MADKNAAGGAGLLGTGVSQPPFFRRIVNLYKSDLPFRGLLDFAVIGAAVLLFLHPPSSDTWSSFSFSNLGLPFGGGSGNQSGSGGQAKGGGQSGTGGQSGSSATNQSNTTNQQSSSGGTAGSTVAAVPFANEVKRPALTNTMLVEIDDTAFRSSAAADQPKLIAAARAFRSRQYAEMIEILKDARASDPNVAFMRGMSLGNRGDVESRRASAQNFQIAADAGHQRAAVVLGRMLITAPEGITKNVDLGRQMIEKAVATGDRLAQRIEAVAYMSGEFGVFDPVKARDLFSKSAQAGDPQAMLQYSNMLFSGIAGATDAVAGADYLQRAAAAGLTGAQETLGNWLVAQYKTGAVADPREAVEWLERAYKTGHSAGALVDLSAFYINTGRAPPWNDRDKYFELVKKCSGLSSSPCQYNVALAFHNGWGTGRDLVRAYAHYQVAKELGLDQAGKNAQSMESQLTASERTSALEMARNIRTNLRPFPPIWYMQYPGAQPPPEPWVEANYGAPPPATAQPVADTGAPGIAAINFGSELVKATAFWSRWIDINVSAFQSSPGAVQAKLSAAARAYREGQLDEILSALKDAGTGDANVAFMRAIGTYFIKGGNSADDNRAVEQMLTEAVRGGQADAAAVLASLLIFQHDGITKNTTEGRRLLEQGAQRKARYALRQLGTALSSGLLGEADFVTAARHVRASADAGDPAANIVMAAYFQRGAGVEKDMKLAEVYLRQAAKLGLTNAQYVLGRWLLQRYKENQIAGPEEGLQWLDRAYQRGSALAALDETILFYANATRGTSWRNQPKALETARACIGLKSANCHSYYAFLLYRGEGVTHDQMRSYAHYDVSRSLGNSSAVKSLEEREKQLTANELATARDLSRAIQQRLKPLPNAVTFQPPLAN